MNINYSSKVMEAFSFLEHVYVQGEPYDLIGYAGETSVGEHVNLYFQINRELNYADSKITKARFSAMGSVMLIAAAEKFCALVENLTFQDAIKQTGELTGVLSAPDEKVHSVMFVVQAFYKAFETLTNS